LTRSSAAPPLSFDVGFLDLGGLALIQTQLSKLHVGSSGDLSL
jgi:hypothetical protein